MVRQYVNPQWNNERKDRGDRPRQAGNLEGRQDAGKHSTS